MFGATVWAMAIRLVEAPFLARDALVVSVRLCCLFRRNLSVRSPGFPTDPEWRDPQSDGNDSVSLRYSGSAPVIAAPALGQEVAVSMGFRGAPVLASHHLFLRGQSVGRDAARRPGPARVSRRHIDLDVGSWQQDAGN